MNYITYICIGGPIDGDWRTMELGVEYMRVAEIPQAEVTPRYTPEPCNAEITLHLYRLEFTPDFGFVWMYQGEDK